MITHPPDLPEGVCLTCGGSGFEPSEFYQPDPDLGRLSTPCPTCDGTGEQPPSNQRSEGSEA